MSQSVRQNRLFAAEDWQAIYRSFQDVDFRAYDFDTMRNALIDYIRAQYPEDFNDYIASSEFIAMIELLAYLGASLSFRHDLNSRENFLDTAERRESVLRLARMLSYTPKRNIAASGVFKVSAVETNESVKDSLGRNLSNVTVFWNDPNNVDSLEQVTAILNAAFDSNHSFGRPFKSGFVGNIPTDLYRINGPNTEVAYNISIPIRGTRYPFDIVNADFADGQFFYERHPDPAEAFHMIYRNDGEGLGSPNSGFFVLFKQGNLLNVDNRYEVPLRNRTTDVDINNINETDVYVQEIDQAGAVVNRWRKVPALVGTNVIYNSINNNTRNIFSVIPRLNDQITLKFSDGNFGNVPTGLFRTWVRTSANRKIVLRPEDVRNYEILLPYIGADGQAYRLRVIFSLEQTVSNGEPAEANFQIKERAPQVFYTQNRMVNGEDYNVFPLTRGNEILKLKAVNRSHAGHSRYIDINDPTGTFQNVLVFGDDGALYYDDEPNRLLVSGSVANEDIAGVSLQNFMSNERLKNFFYSAYYDEFLEAFPEAFNLSLSNYFWETAPKTASNSTGYFKDSSLPTFNAVLLGTSFVTTGAALLFVSPVTGLSSWAAIRSIINEGLVADVEDPTIMGPVELNTAIDRTSQAIALTPAFRTLFTDAELEIIEARIDLQADFGIGYDVRGNQFRGEWYVVPGTPTGSETFDINDVGGQIERTTSTWIIFASYNAADDMWSFTTRGKRYIFESKEDVRFFFDPGKAAIDTATGRPLKDKIEILRTNTVSNTDPSILGSAVTLEPSSLVIYEDGHQDPRKVEVVPPDADSDGLPDEPLGIEEFLQNAGPEEIFFERIVDFDGYEYFQLWRGGAAFMANLPFALTELSGSWLIQTDPLTSQPVSLNDIDMLIYTSPIGASSPFSIENVINTQSASLDSQVALVKQVLGKIIYYRSTNTFYVIVQGGTAANVNVISSQDYSRRYGRSFQQDERKVDNPLYFKLEHFAPRANRVDPSISNIIDMMVLTGTYYRDIIVWKDSNDITAPIPLEPTTEDLRVQFAELNEYKMLSDQLIFKPGKFKILFGIGATDELRARFKVVKTPNATVTDNEIRSGVIAAIDEYFDIANWDFGESFFYTELAAYIHQRLANLVASVVIVPQKAESVFGNLFQVKAEADELFISTATVSDVEIVRNLTETNLRVGK